MSRPPPPIRVVLADDTPEIRKLIRVNLELQGGFLIVGEAEDGAEAVALARAEQPDAIVLDLAMPVLDGLQAIPKIRRFSPRTKIAVLSGFHGSTLARKALDCGAHRYLEKGTAFAEVASALRELCGAQGTNHADPVSTNLDRDDTGGSDPLESAS
jgi:YesN/AraC family two-component response regulator